MSGEDAVGDRTAATGTLPEPIDLARVRPDAPMSKRARRAVSSPVSVEATFEVSNEQKRIMQPLTTLTLLVVYTDLVRRQLWYAGFTRGRRDRRIGEAVEAWERTGRLRALATRHLTEPSADGWTCVAGAIALANAWAFLSDEIPRVIAVHFEFSLATRMRLAVCLSVAWKFHRATCSHFPRQFDSEEPSLLGPHTHELAYLGYVFMTLPEQDAFGGWSDENIEAIRDLYDELTALEVDLLARVNVFSLLTETPLDHTEARAAALLARGVVTPDCAMAVRALAPLFTYCSSGAAGISGGALVCASVFALGVASNPKALLRASPELMHTEFTREERIVAWGLLHSAVVRNKMAEQMVAVGCYGDHRWRHYEYVTDGNLRAALNLATLATG